MDSRLYMQRAENEIKLANILFSISATPQTQTEVFGVAEPETYYSAVISHSYYAIFYAAKAYLSKQGIKISAPEEHKKTFEKFKSFVDSGEIDLVLLQIYREALIRAEVLLGIFFREKQKRGKFTYRTLPQANKEPAHESVENAKTFFKHLGALTGTFSL